MSEVHKALLEIQRDLKCEKSQYNSFGKYSYRSKEDILEAVKPLAHEHGCDVIVSDGIEVVAEGWVYCRSTAYLTDVETGEDVAAVGWAREPESKKGMDASQITGTAASYAGKRALGNLFAIDDTADADKLNDGTTQGPFDAACTACGTVYRFESAEQMSKSACQCGNRQFKDVS